MPRQLTLAALSAASLLPPATYGVAPFQPAGLVDMPTARVIPDRVGVISSSMLLYSSAIRTHTKGSQSIALGLFDWAHVGLVSESEGNLAGYAQIRLTDQSRYMPAVAIGVQNLWARDNISEYGQDFYYSSGQSNSFYAVMTKDLDLIPDFDLSVTAGIGSGRFRGTSRYSSSVQGIFVGVEAWITDYFRVSMEEDGADGNIGASFKISDALLFHVALAEVESAFNAEFDPSQPDPKMHAKLNFGVNYIFDSFRPPLSRKEAKVKEIRRQQEENRLLLEELEKLRARRRDAEERIEAYRAALSAIAPSENETGDTVSRQD